MGRGRARLKGDAEEALGGVEIRRFLRGQEAGEGVNRGQADIAGGGGHLPLLLQVVQKRHDAVDGQIGDVEGGDRSLRGAGQEAEEEREAVAVAADRMGAHAADRREMVPTERAQRRGQSIRRGRHRRGSRRVGPAIRRVL